VASNSFRYARYLNVLIWAAALRKIKTGKGESPQVKAQTPTLRWMVFLCWKTLI